MSKANDIVADVLESTGVPFRYRKFKGEEIKPPPYITYFLATEHHYGSDERNLLQDTHVIIDLFTAEKDFELEAHIDLQLAGFEFTKNEDYEYSDEIFRVTYELDIKTKNRRTQTNG